MSRLDARREEDLFALRAVGERASQFAKIAPDHFSPLRECFLISIITAFYGGNLRFLDSLVRAIPFMKPGGSEELLGVIHDEARATGLKKLFFQTLTVDIEVNGLLMDGIFCGSASGYKCLRL